LGVGGNDTRKIVEELQTRDFLLYCNTSVSPFYNKPTQEGIYQHFKAISQASPTIIIYNVPGRTSSNMLPKTVLRLANDFQNIVVKRSSWGYGSSYANSKR
jgi:4-hydroxy-tetrahydrodipicolinate synthase